MPKKDVYNDETTPLFKSYIGQVREGRDSSGRPNQKQWQPRYGTFGFSWQDNFEHDYHVPKDYKGSGSNEYGAIVATTIKDVHSGGIFIFDRRKNNLIWRVFPDKTNQEIATILNYEIAFELGYQTVDELPYKFICITEDSDKLALICSDFDRIDYWRWSRLWAPREGFFMSDVGKYKIDRLFMKMETYLFDRLKGPKPLPEHLPKIPLHSDSEEWEAALIAFKKRKLKDLGIVKTVRPVFRFEGEGYKGRLTKMVELVTDTSSWVEAKMAGYSPL